MTRIAGHLADRTLANLDCLGIEAFFSQPEIDVEALFQDSSASTHLRRAIVISHQFQQIGHPHAGSIRICLHLHQRQRQRCERPIRVHHRVARVLSPLDAQPG